jgi:O-antigen ligase
VTTGRLAVAGGDNRMLLAVTAAIGLGAIGIALVVTVAGPALAIAPFALAAAAWAWWRFPGASLAAYLFLPFYKASLGPLSPVDLTPVLAMGAAVQVIPFLAGRHRYLGSRAGLVLWVALSAAILAGVLWAVQQQIAVDRAAFWWILILFPSLAALRIASKPGLIDQFVSAGFAIGVVITVLGIPGMFGAGRLSVGGENTLQTGAITLIVALVSIFWTLRVAPAWARPLAAILIVVAMIESIASGSRGPLLAFLVALGFGVVGRLRNGRPLSRRDGGLAVLAIAAVGGLVVAVSRLPAQSIDRLLLLGGLVGPGGSAGSSIDTRVDLYSLATWMFTQSPLIGHGTGSFAAYTTTRAGLQVYAYPHNDLLQLAAELGVVGAAMFVALVGIGMLRRIPETPAWITVRILLVFMLVLGMTSGDIYGDRLMWGLLVLVVSAPVIRGTADGAPTGAEPAVAGPPDYPPDAVAAPPRPPGGTMRS